ncbi:hypothetical protein IG631_13872 [Alternaria alternata]|nr:hypothetical protein IG631_13872 [Alternaria alternata]
MTTLVQHCFRNSLNRKYVERGSWERHPMNHHYNAPLQAREGKTQIQEHRLVTRSNWINFGAVWRTWDKPKVGQDTAESPCRTPINQATTTTGHPSSQPR